MKVRVFVFWYGVKMKTRNSDFSLNFLVSDYHFIQEIASFCFLVWGKNENSETDSEKFREFLAFVLAKDSIRVVQFVYSGKKGRIVLKEASLLRSFGLFCSPNFAV